MSRNNDKIKGLGFVACYIKDYDFEHVTDMPEKAAVAWVKSVCPDVVMGLSTKAKDLTIATEEDSKTYDTDATCNGWLNKLFIIVGHEHGKWIALYNHDGRFAMKIGRH